jgi:hypothetical protein
VTALSPLESCTDLDAAPSPAPERHPPAEPAHSGHGWWLRDFRFSGGRVEVFATGADLRLDRTLVGEALVWLKYHAAVRLRALGLAMAGRGGPRIWFTPQMPRPWYLVWSALAWSGGRVAASPEQADAVFAFEDSTWATTGPAPQRPVLNGACRDVSKSTVARVFEEVFGYPLALDPTHWRGAAVQKSEINGAHDGAVVACPAPRLPGMHYQRLIDSSDGAFTYDLRTACVGGRPVAVWIKRKPVDGRFSIHNLSVSLHRPQDVFSLHELAQIERFAATMQIDWAGLDILRDRRSGLIYVVDVNKTDVGPIIALSWRDKLRSTALLSQALTAMVADKKRRPAPGQI